MEIRFALFVIKTVTSWQKHFEPGMVKTEIVEEAAGMLQEATETLVDAYGEGQKLLQTHDAVRSNYREAIKEAKEKLEFLTGQYNASKQDREHLTQENDALLRQVEDFRRLLSDEIAVKELWQKEQDDLQVEVEELTALNNLLYKENRALREAEDDLHGRVARSESERIQKLHKARETLGTSMTLGCDE